MALGVAILSPVRRSQYVTSPELEYYRNAVARVIAFVHRTSYSCNEMEGTDVGCAPLEEEESPMAKAKTKKQPVRAKTRSLPRDLQNLPDERCCCPRFDG